MADNPDTTNQRTKLEAAIKGLESLGSRVYLYRGQEYIEGPFVSEHFPFLREYALCSAEERRQFLLETNRVVDEQAQLSAFQGSRDADSRSSDCGIHRGRILRRK